MKKKILSILLSTALISQIGMISQTSTVYAEGGNRNAIQRTQSGGKSWGSCVLSWAIGGTLVASGIGLYTLCRYLRLILANQKPKPAVPELEPESEPESASEPEPEPEPESESEPESEPESAPKSAMLELEPAPMPELKPKLEPAPMPEPKPKLEPAPMPEPKPESEPESASEPVPAPISTSRAVITMMFYGTGMTFDSYKKYFEKSAPQGQDAKTYAKQKMERKFGKKVIPGIRAKGANSNSVAYSAEGPGTTDTGKLSIRDAQERVSGFLINVINEKIRSHDEIDEIQVCICGHSRGGVSASLVATELQKHYENENKVKITLIASDPYAGPFNRLHKEMAEFDANETNDKQICACVVYSMGTQFSCTPQQIKNAEKIIITTLGHNDSSDLVYCFKRLDEGIYIDIEGDIRRGKIRKITNIATFRKYIPLLCLHEKSYSGRETVIKNVIVQKLGLNPEVLTSLPDYKVEMQKLKGKISGASDIKKLVVAVEDAKRLFAVGGAFLGLVKLDGNWFYPALVNICAYLKTNKLALAKKICVDSLPHLKKPFKREIITAIEIQINNLI